MDKKVILKQKYINDILVKQENIEWNIYPDYESDYPISEKCLLKMSINELKNILEIVIDIEQQEEERYEEEFIKHGRAE
jgi:hypothetical protein